VGGFEPTFWKTTGLIAVSMIVIALGVKAIELARRAARPPDEVPDDDLLGPIRTAYEAGLMREDEYRRARAALGLPAADPTIPRVREPTPGPGAPDVPPPESGPSA